MKNYLDLSPEVAAALQEGKPVVALESTIISHGMPYPQNVETALRVEQTIREEGAVPATIAVIGGRLKAGLTPDQIEYLGKKGTAVTKASRRDLPVLVARGEDGATTVTTTMIIAALAGIKVFATGGIGGVHRGAETTFDISRDLKELGSCDVTVICSGAKAILDIPKTLEYLETEGVTVLSNKAKTFANFYSVSSSDPVDYAFETPEEAAKIIAAKRSFGLAGGILISNPIPEEFALPHEYIDSIVDQAVKEAEEQGIKGKDSTPFLLKRIVELSGGKSLDSNIHLVINNAVLGAKIAAALCNER